MLFKDEEKHRTTSLAYGEGRSLVTMAEYIGDALGIKPDMSVEPSRIGEVTHYIANIGKARALLGYSPTILLQDGIKLAVAWGKEFTGK